MTLDLLQSEYALVLKGRVDGILSERSVCGRLITLLLVLAELDSDQS